MVNNNIKRKLEQIGIGRSFQRDKFPGMDQKFDPYFFSSQKRFRRKISRKRQSRKRQSRKRQSRKRSQFSSI